MSPRPLRLCIAVALCALTLVLSGCMLPQQAKVVIKQIGYESTAGLVADTLEWEETLPDGTVRKFKATGLNREVVGVNNSLVPIFHDGYMQGIEIGKALINKVPDIKVLPIPGP